MNWYQWVGGGLLAVVGLYIVCRLVFLAYFISKRQAGGQPKERQ